MFFFLGAGFVIAVCCWLDVRDRRREQERAQRLLLPAPEDHWAEDTREAEDPDGEIAALNDLWDSPAFGEGAER